ncbi:glycoside hydrolase family 43 protein [Marinoscillum furvescens]|uniref:Glycosyl hydrolase family 43 n=1 Tax=Marinoscillum furvescens DSM 4134 TaxID=1122208 RepID=A0A3D9L079_MARFU|nr:glycoside hydrolase family 43 protein [Marinoscillum furvescens]RED96587.1 glycosyl hydrolase family 43 [Marinoscillum furvescens DSM 4134]
MNRFNALNFFVLTLIILSGCQPASKEGQTEKKEGALPVGKTDPLVTHLYTADPSAHVFEDKLYIYPSHDIESGIPEDDLGSHFDMKDYHVFSMKEPGAEVKDHGVALDVKDVPWAARQMWAPDAAEKDGKYFLYFPAKDKQDVFRIGVAVGDRPEGPFTPESEPIAGSFSIDPAVYADDDGAYYLYFGGIWGGQLQNWQSGQYDANGQLPKPTEDALLPKVARLSEDMRGLAEEPRDVLILDENGDLLKEGDNHRRFFEAAWVHQHEGVYYLSYSTGDTHKIVYATGDNPYGPFTYRGVVLKPVIGWTNHHSIVKFQGKWYLFYHDSSLSGGRTFLRSIKMAELKHRADGTIVAYDAYVK